MTSASQQLLAAVERLAAAADEQEAYLRQLGTAPSADELALEFTDAFVVARERLDESAADAATRLDDYLVEISGSDKAELWTVSALRDAPEWVRVRHLAGVVLRRLRR